MSTYTSRTLFAIYAITFLVALQIALPLYINSSFLSQFFTENILGLVYSAGALLTLFVLTYYPKILNHYGSYKTLLALLFLQFVMLIILALSSIPLIIISAFLIIQVFLSLIFFNLDVFLENYSEDKNTGTLRGIMLTAINIAILLGPLFAGIILTDGDFWKIYLISSFLLLPATWIVIRRLRGFRDPIYDHTPFFAKIRQVLFANYPYSEIRHVVIASFLMRFFFSWMVLYTPIYLKQYVGFSWGEIGIILPVMLLPFVLLEFPVGKLLDRGLNEKNTMVTGFVITALFTASLFFINNASIIIWALLLFGTRVGVSLVEISSESCFFKHIKSKDTNTLSIFRDMRPIAWLLGPLTASLLLVIVHMQYLFPILALIMLYGAWSSAKMQKI